jgi:hypothetical protein
MIECREKVNNKNLLRVFIHPKQGCLSCGTTENMGTRKYCSVSCRQRLRHMLNRRTGLLKALNTRYATFYFTDMAIIMDLLPYGSKQIFTFIFSRSADRSPADDFCRLSDELGNAWWAEKRRTNRRYLASRHVFDLANLNHVSSNCVSPFELKLPSVKGTALIYLRLNKFELDAPNLCKRIKSAYREQAKKHHPDIGGNSETFRKIRNAYEELINWAENPVYLNRRGFPDKWFYDGLKNRWVQPTPG